MSTLDDVVRVSIQIASSAITLPGFGRPLILPSVDPPFSEPSRLYTDPDDMLDDGFTILDDAYLMAQTLAQQSPRPVDWLVGRRTTASVQERTIRVAGDASAQHKRTLRFTEPATDGDWTIEIDGTPYTYTASSDNITTIRNELLTQIDTAANGIAATPLVLTNEGLVLISDEPFEITDLSAPSGGAADITLVQHVKIAAGATGLWRLDVDGSNCDFVATTATPEDIRDGLVASINALTGTHGAVAVDAAATDTLYVDAGAEFVLTFEEVGPGGTGELNGSGWSYAEGATLAGDWTITIDGVPHTFTATGANTLTEIRDGLRVLIVGGALPVTAADQAVDTDVGLKLTGTAGIPFTATLSDPTEASRMTFVQTFDVTTAAVGLWRLDVGGTNCDETAVVADAEEIRDGLVFEVNALTGTHGATAIEHSTNTSLGFIDSTAETAIALELTPGAGAGTINDAWPWSDSAGGPGGSLAAIEDYNPDWYCLLIPERDKDTIVAFAGDIEAREKIFLAQSSDAAVVASPYTPASPTPDVASRLKDLSYFRTSVWFHDVDAEHKAAAMAGRALPEIPSSITWKWKQLIGVAPTVLTSNQRANLLSKSANSSESRGGRHYSFEGTVASGEFLDIIRGRDKLKSRIQERVFEAQLASPKIPFTDGGIGQIEGASRAAVEESTTEGFIATDPPVEWTVPKAADIPSGDKAKRELLGTNAIKFNAKVQGAIHLAEIRGTVSA